MFKIQTTCPQRPAISRDQCLIIHYLKSISQYRVCALHVSTVLSPFKYHLCILRRTHQYNRTTIPQAQEFLYCITCTQNQDYPIIETTSTGPTSPKSQGFTVLSLNTENLIQETCVRKGIPPHTLTECNTV